MMTTEEIQDAIRLIQENVDEAVTLWTAYENQWMETNGPLPIERDDFQAIAAVQAFRHSKAAHLRQIAIARAELAGLKVLL